MRQATLLLVPLITVHYTSVIHGGIIPQVEKVFSIFEPHTEWGSKGKAGVPFELGVKVRISKVQHQFILHHQVMEKITDDQMVVSISSNHPSTGSSTMLQAMVARNLTA